MRDHSSSFSHPASSSQQVRSQVESDLGPAIFALLGNTNQPKRIERVEEQFFVENNEPDHQNPETEKAMDQLREENARLKQQNAKLKQENNEKDAKIAVHKANLKTATNQNLRWVEKHLADQETVQTYCQTLDDDQRRLQTANGNNAEHDAILQFINKTLHKAEKMQETIRLPPKADGEELNSV